jgi:hypothetical protein
VPGAAPFNLPASNLVGSASHGFPTNPPQARRTEFVIGQAKGGERGAMRAWLGSHVRAVHVRWYTPGIVDKDKKEPACAYR